jgi:hypothetical protein
MDLEKVKSRKDIDTKLILSWKTPRVEKLLSSSQAEIELLTAFENDLFNTPNEPKITPREMLYALTTKKNLSSEFIKELKDLTSRWFELTTSTWSQNVLPFYSAELEYILFML